MAEYTYLACDWATHTVIDELQLSGLPLTDPLNKGGTFQTSLAIDTNKPWQTQIDATEPYRTVLFVKRDNIFIWGGFCWIRDWDSSNKKLALSYGQYDTYFDQRRYAATTDWVATDQLTIARALIDHAQGGSGSVGVLHGNPANLSGVLRDRSIKIEEQKMVGQLLNDLSGVQGGFDYHFDIEEDVNTGLAAVKFWTFYPYRGVAPQATSLVFEYPGNILKYVWPEGGTFATHTYEVGGQPEATSGDQATGGYLQSLVANATLLSQGYPQIDQTFNRSDVIIQSTLDAHAAEDARLAATTPSIPSITVDPAAEPVYGSYVTGDYAKISIEDQRFPNGMEVWARIVDRQLKTSGPGSGEELVLVLERADIPS